MSGSRQLFGVDFPTTNMLGPDVATILSVQPASVSPDGTEALLAVRVTLSDGNQIDRHIFLDLTSGSYGNVIETVLGEGSASNVVAKAVDVIWGDGTNPQVLASYVDLTDPIYATVSSSSWKYELVGLVDSQNIISSDLIEDATGQAGNGTITRIVADKAGQFFAFESLAGNYIGSTDTANYDDNGTKDIYVAGTDGTGLQRISVVPEFGAQPSEDVHLLDYRRVEGEDQIVFESSENQWASFTEDTNTAPDLFLYRSAAAEPIEIISRTPDDTAIGFVSGQALFAEVLGNSGVVYVTESGALSPLDSEDPAQPDFVIFDTINNANIALDPVTLTFLGGVVKAPNFEINLQGSGAGQLFVTMTNASVGDKSWGDNPQLVALGASGAEVLSLTSSEVFGQPAGTPADGGIDSATITEAGDALMNTRSLLLTTESGGSGLIVSAANNYDVTAPTKNARPDNPYTSASSATPSSPLTKSVMVS